ncbi:MAG: DNA alkylation repair protein [Lachnospiraceae bacterium]|nr:DNA alkylation repair protein [Lachnospiraceae bacterium]
MNEQIREQLLAMQEVNYREFSAALVPGVENMLGIRLPQLRSLAKQIAKADWREMLKDEDIYFEEKMLRGMVLGYASKNMDEMLPYIGKFIPLVDNWSVCDSVFMGMTIFQRDRERTWDFIQPYLRSDREFEVRVALIIMMQHLLKCDEEGKKISRLRVVDTDSLTDTLERKGLYLERVLTAASEVDTTGYYASMADSWLLAEAFCCFPYHTYCFLKSTSLDDRTYNKALQKIIESRIPTDEVKVILRQMKRQ